MREPWMEDRFGHGSLKSQMTTTESVFNPCFIRGLFECQVLHRVQ
jgi:hypothetical protein